MDCDAPPSQKGNKRAKVWVEKNEEKTLVACLSQNTPYVRMDLGFSVGEEVSFYTKGTNSDVYLSGFLVPPELLSKTNNHDNSGATTAPINTKSKRKSSSTQNLAINAVNDEANVSREIRSESQRKSSTCISTCLGHFLIYIYSDL